MNTRERILAGGLLAVILLGGGAFLFSQAYLAPLREKDAGIAEARQEIETKRAQVRQALVERNRLDRLRMLSLPADVDLARREYEKYLSELMRDSGFQPGSFSVTPKPADDRNVPMMGGKKPIYTRLTFTVLAHADLPSLVKMQEGFYRTGLLHQIRNFSIQRPLTTGSEDRPQDLDINLTIEALIVTGAGNRPQLLPNIDPRLLVLDGLTALRHGPIPLGLAAWTAGPTGPRGPGDLATPPRRYDAIASKNIFMGPAARKDTAPAVEVTRFVYLTDISRTERYDEAFLFDRYNNQKTRLRASRGFDRFRIKAGENAPPVEGTVVHIGPRDVIFQSGDGFYDLHIGESLRDALHNPLSRAQVDSLMAGSSTAAAPTPPAQ